MSKYVLSSVLFIPHDKFTAAADVPESLCLISYSTRRKATRELSHTGFEAGGPLFNASETPF
jgi:hypothetical protein